MRHSGEKEVCSRKVGVVKMESAVMTKGVIRMTGVVKSLHSEEIGVLVKVGVVMEWVYLESGRSDGVGVVEKWT